MNDCVGAASSDPQAGMRRPVRLAYVVSHPIQYQAPMLRRIALEPDIDLTVFFESDFSQREYADPGFGVSLMWDVPLLEGYRHEFLTMVHDHRTSAQIVPIFFNLFSRLRGHPGGTPFDVLWVHGYASMNSLSAMLAARALGIHVLLRAESWLGDRERSILRLGAKAVFFSVLRNLVDAALPIGTRNETYWRHYLGDSMPLFQMPYAVDNRFFAERSRAAGADRTALQAELCLDPGRPVILFAAKLQPRKNCAHLISAYARLHSQPAMNPKPYLVIVGDGEEREALKRQANDTTAAEGVRFCGFRNQSELPRFFDLATVFVLPSRHEPWGLIVNEVMNAGRATIVSTDAGCQPDLITDGVEGCVFPVGDVAALAEALRRVLATPGEAAAMGLRAASRISKWSFEQDLAGLRAAIFHVTRRPQP